LTARQRSSSILTLLVADAMQDLFDEVEGVERGGLVG
jgi:hypothetical protein